MRKEPMKRIALSILMIAGLLIFSGNEAFPVAGNTPDTGTMDILASVNGKPIFRGQFMQALASLQEEENEGGKKIPNDPPKILERLINVEMIVQEAMNIGLEDLPVVKEIDEGYRLLMLRKLLYSYHVRNIKAPDKKAVEKLYRQAIKEVKVSSVRIEKEADAKNFEKEVKAGGEFKELVKKWVAEGKAKGGDQGAYIKAAELNPEVSKALSKMKPGSVTPALKIGKGYTLVKIEGTRSIQDPEALKKAKAEAEEQALKNKRTSAMETYAETLKKKYVKVDEKIFESLDYDSPQSGLDNMLKDQRVLVRIKGDPPVTVAEMSNAIRKKFYHGAERAGSKKKINSRKGEVLEEMIFKKVSIKEAYHLKIDQTPQFKGMVEDNLRGVLFGIFLERVIGPEIKVEEAEVKAYQEAHSGEYSLPEEMKIQALVFGNATDAADALDKLKKGADLQWIKGNAQGQIGREQSKNLLEFKGDMVPTEKLPDGVRKAVSGGDTGDFLLYASPEGPVYLLYIQEKAPARPLPYEAVKEPIGKKLYQEKQQNALDLYLKKLRAGSEVKVFATDAQLEKLVFSPSR